jgi:hypothetical protein
VSIGEVTLYSSIQVVGTITELVGIPIGTSIYISGEWLAEPDKEKVNRCWGRGSRAEN